MRFGGRYEDWAKAQEAMRDILFLYRDLTEYCGIVGDHDTGTFTPWPFIDCSVDDGYGGPETEKLLREGTAGSAALGPDRLLGSRRYDQNQHRGRGGGDCPESL
jgi:hypothetical protein